MAQLNTTAATTVTYSRMSVPAFKQAMGIEAFDVVLSTKPKADGTPGGRFVSTSDGRKFNCQQNIDHAKPVEFLVIDGNIEGACFVNKGTANVEATY